MLHLAAAAIVVALACPLAAQETRPQTRLVVMISVDQLATHVLEGAWPHLGQDGFRRLEREGAWYPNCAYDHSCTETGPGHATLATGASPSVHGIVRNEWIDPATGATIPCVADPSVLLVPGGGPGASAHRLLAPTLGDTMKKIFGPGAKVASVSLKDRSAILMAGPSADFVAWFDASAGGFTTSSAFARGGSEATIALLAGLNQAKPIGTYATWDWTKAGSPAAYADLGPDDEAAELALGGSKAFPHRYVAAETRPVTFHERMLVSPAGNEIVLAAALLLLKKGELGRDAVPDLLAVGFSSNDLVGHACGPGSHEVRDMTLRTDALLADLLRALDETVGPGLYNLLLSADHGVGPVPEIAVRKGVAAGRVNQDKVRGAVEAALKQRLGAPPDGQHWVAKVSGPELLLNRKLLGDRKIALAEAQDVAAKGAAKANGIAEAIALHTVFDGSLSRSPIHDAVKRGQHRDRAVDLCVVPKPFHLFGSTVASHGTPHDYDRRVPLFLLGPGVRRGYAGQAAVSPGSGIVTLAQALGIAPPARANHPALADALAK